MRKAIFPILFLAIALGFTARSSCSNRDLIPFLGKWTGAFVVDVVREGPDTARDRTRSSLRGFIQVYATNRTFKMYLDGEQESLELDGTWTEKGRRLTLHVKEPKVDDLGGADNRDPNRKFVDAEDIRVAYAHPIVLDLTTDRHRLVGLPVTLGPLLGHHEFTKDASKVLG